MVSRRAFTLIELLVVIAIMAIVAAILFPVFSHAKQRAQGIQCVNNMRQMTMGWQLYTDENNNYYPPNSATGHFDPTVGEDMINPSWVAGVLSTSGNNPAGVDDNTNTTKLIDNRYMPYGSIGGYTKEASLYRCPGDTSMDPLSGQPRVRSIAMNGWINPGRINGNNSPQWGQPIVKITRPTDFHGISPSEIFVFMDENAQSIDDGWFWVSTSGYNNDGSMNMGNLQAADLPGLYHNRCTTISFADGRADLHHWTDPDTFSLRFVSGPQSTPYNEDVAWLMTHATIPQ